jgi:hypothetical protein
LPRVVADFRADFAADFDAVPADALPRLAVLVLTFFVDLAII